MVFAHFKCVLYFVFTLEAGCSLEENKLRKNTSTEITFVFSIPVCESHAPPSREKNILIRNTRPHRRLNWPAAHLRPSFSREIMKRLVLSIQDRPEASGACKCSYSEGSVATAVRRLVAQVL